MGAVASPRKAAPAASAAELRRQVESFLASCQDPVLIEPGEAPYPVAQDSRWSLAERPDCLLIEAWDEARSLARRVVGVKDIGRGRMVMEVRRFGGRAGELTLADRNDARAAPALQRASRAVLREMLGRWLARQFPVWQMRELTSGADLEHTLSPACPRALITLGRRRCAALAAPRPGADGALALGLIWMDYLTRRDGAPVERLALFLPRGTETNTVLRLQHLTTEATLFAYDSEGLEEPIDLADRGNLASELAPWIEPPGPARDEAARWAHWVAEEAGVEKVAAAPGEWSLRVNGLEFARYAGGALYYGVERRRRARSAEPVAALARALERVRGADSGEPGHAWRRRNPEAWLESVLRQRIEMIDAGLYRAPVYGQVAAVEGRARGVADLLALGRDGRLAVIEVKAEEDANLPLQALDYWIRVARHAGRGEFTLRGYFRGLKVSRAAPRLVLAAPALRFHPSTETILSHFAGGIEVVRVGLGVEWQRVPRVVLRARGAERPEWDGPG